MGNKKNARRGREHRFIYPDQHNIDDEAVPVPVIGNDDEGSESESDSGDSPPVKEAKPCGVSHLIKTHNPNRTGLPPNRENAPMNRKERKALKDPLAGKSKMELEKDFMRLQLARREREEKEQKIQEEKKAKEAAKAAAAERAQVLLETRKNVGKKGGRKPGAKIGKNKAVASTAAADSNANGDEVTSGQNPEADPDICSHEDSGTIRNFRICYRLFTESTEQWELGRAPKLIFLVLTTSDNFVFWTFTAIDDPVISVYRVTSFTSGVVFQPFPEVFSLRNHIMPTLKLMPNAQPLSRFEVSSTCILACSGRT
nr:expressed protein [Hymenolepis microstoma]